MACVVDADTRHRNIFAIYVPHVRSTTDQTFRLFDPSQNLENIRSNFRYLSVKKVIFFRVVRD